jgi:hypothetical protein
MVERLGVNPRTPHIRLSSGGAYRTRTGCLLLAKQAL